MNDKSQLDKFKEAAEAVGADTSDDALDKIMEKLDLTKPDETEEKDKG